METELLIARIKDTAELCIKTSKPKFFGFLSAEQAVLAQKILNVSGCEFEFYGGYDNSQRVMLGCFPEWCSEHSFPISAVTFSYRPSDELHHRDFLGSLMALGIKRETVGDILTESGRTVVFVNSDIENYVLTQISKIGRTGVTVIKGCTHPLPCSNTLADFTQTAASARLDCIVSAVCGVSRGTASEIIEEGLVSVNSVVCEKTAKTVCGGDILTVRGKGKFIISSLNGKTKKNRIILNYQKYI